jgi:hypothetical protein
MTDGRQTFPDVAPGDHIIFIYDDSADLFAFVIPFITAGVARGERCLYIVDSKPAEAREALAARGLKIARDAKRGAFAVVAAREFFGYPPFNASQAVEHMRRAETDALAAGFTGLRVAGDWAWTLEPRVLDTELSEFESLLEITAGPGRLTLACLYRRDRTDPAALERLVREHGKVIASDYILLGLSALFRSLARTDLQSLAQSARARTIRKGGLIFAKAIRRRRFTC